jgi:hypothetical protein
MSAPVKLPFAMSAEVMALSRMSAESTALLAIFAEVTAPVARSAVPTAPSLMSTDLTRLFLMSLEPTVFLPVSAPAVPLIASTSTATIGARLGLRPFETGVATRSPVFFKSSIKTPGAWLGASWVTCRLLWGQT